MAGFVPEDIAVFGMVMLLKPAVPFGPVIVKDSMLVLLAWDDVIVTLDICELVMFPLIARLTVAPLPVFAVIFVANRVEVGEGVGVGMAPGLDVMVGPVVGVGVDVEVGVATIGTENVLLVPVEAPSVAVMVTAKPPAVTVTEVDPTPLTKAFMVPGLIDPAEYVKDGVPE
jgi:hypothetical protein